VVSRAYLMEAINMPVVSRAYLMEAINMLPTNW